MRMIMLKMIFMFFSLLLLTGCFDSRIEAENKILKNQNAILVNKNNELSALIADYKFSYETEYWRKVEESERFERQAAIAVRCDIVFWMCPESAVAAGRAAIAKGYGPNMYDPNIFYMIIGKFFLIILLLAFFRLILFLLWKYYISPSKIKIRQANDIIEEADKIFAQAKDKLSNFNNDIIKLEKKQNEIEYEVQIWSNVEKDLLNKIGGLERDIFELENKKGEIIIQQENEIKKEEKHIVEGVSTLKDMMRPKAIKKI